MLIPIICFLFQIMKENSKNPSLSTIIDTANESIEAFAELYETFQRCGKALDSYVDEMRDKCPRLCFLSNHDVVTLTGQRGMTELASELTRKVTFWILLSIMN